MHAPLKQVAILIESSTGWGRRLIEGILTESNSHQRWHNWVQPEGVQNNLYLPEGWAVDGIISIINTPKVAEQLQQYNVPVVNVSSVSLPGQTAPQITTDHEATSQLALEHLTAKGFKHFGYVGPTRLPWVKTHYKDFRKVFRENGVNPACFSKALNYNSQHELQLWTSALTGWLNKQPKPFAVVTWNAPTGRDVIEACRMAGIQVPQEVAVLGSNTDRLLNQACDPPLAAIDDAAIEIGKLAANYLDQMMRGRADLPQVTKVKPTRVVSARSTDMMAVDDPQLVQVMQYLDKHAFDHETSVQSLLSAVPMARRILEQKFQQAFGSTPGEEIRRRRLSRAKELLAETELTTYQIADACGYSSYSYLHKVFKQITGTPPSVYRKKYRH
ncbi:MAG: substrate-binding domain-containing protein [Opitutaceae bacterium]